MRARVLILAGLLALPPGLARADAPEIEIARGHSRRAADLYAAGRYRDAAAEFELARRELALPEIDYDLGRCYEALGDVDRALDAYRRFLAKATTSAARAEVDGRVRVLEAASQAVHERLSAERRRDAAAHRWGRLWPAAAAVGGLALAAGAVSLGLYLPARQQRDELALSCPPACAGSYDRARALYLGAQASLGIAVGLAGVDVVLWGVALASHRSAR